MTASVHEFPATQQQAHFQVLTTTWRGQINSEDITVDALSEALRSARDAGMPGDASVTLRPGDCVVIVEVESTQLRSLPQRGEVQQ